MSIGTHNEAELLAHLCAFYADRRIMRSQFSDAVLALAGAYDCFGCSMLLSQVEATVEEHFCEWWTDCDDGCAYRRDRDKLPPWRDGWLPLRWTTQPGQVRVDRAKHPTMRARDARSAVTPNLRRHIFARDRHKCRSCGGEPPLELDHIIPVSKGGSSEEANLQSLCVKCNREKSDKIAVEVLTAAGAP